MNQSYPLALKSCQPLLQFLHKGRLAWLVNECMAALKKKGVVLKKRGGVKKKGVLKRRG
jgi:hypothetical protein